MTESETSGVRVPPPLFYVAGFVVGAGLELAFPIDGPPDVLRICGAALCVALWPALDGAATLSFRRAGTSVIPFKPTTALVTSGPYRFSRNPMYLGMAFLYIGLALALGVVWALITLPFVIAAADQLVIALEDGYLVRKFGDPYRDYMRRVRRWF